MGPTFSRCFVVLLAALTSAVTAIHAQGLNDLTPELSTSDPVCPRFNEIKDMKSGQTGIPGSPGSHARNLGALTGIVALDLPPVPGGSRSGISNSLGNSSLIDKFIFSALQDAGVQPAESTTDWEFIRRATLDLTGRIPDPNRVLAFVNDTTANKRALLVEELLAKPEWADKWTMFFGDLYKNTASNAQIDRFRPGTLAFYNYIKTALTANKPYDQLARELITATGDNSYNTGEINFNVGGVVTGGPLQDVFDQQTANVADVFLGVAHVNCLLCHNGSGHLTALSLWGGRQTRVAAWGLSSFFSRTYTFSTAVSAAASNPRYWTVTDSSPKAAKDYALNTTTGNRPARNPLGTVNSISPTYMFTGESPKAGENYRSAFARIITADPQFARATVNYFWAYFFGVGLVDPPDQFDPLRLDPDNPPPAPWTLQPSNPRLLNALAKAFIANNYDLKWLMRQIVNSNAYQLSSRYNGQWNEAWSSLYARKFVRRLWAEEVHDAITVSSKSLPTYNLTTYGPLSYAMQFPEPLGIPDGTSGNISGFLDAFLRGNRDDQPRSDDGAILQALNLMNDSLVLSRTSTTSPAGALLPSSLAQPDTQLVNTLFLAVLSRYPTPQEMATALKNLAPASTRSQEAQNLLLTLYNKVDFVFNY